MEFHRLDHLMHAECIVNHVLLPVPSKGPLHLHEMWHRTMRQHWALREISNREFAMVGSAAVRYASDPIHTELERAKTDKRLRAAERRRDAVRETLMKTHTERLAEVLAARTASEYLQIRLYWSAVRWAESCDAKNVACMRERLARMQQLYTGYAVSAVPLPVDP